MEDSSVFKKAPSSMSESQFMTLFGGVYEHTPWVALKTFHRGLSPQQDSVEGLAEAMATSLSLGSDEEKLALIKAHPDLVGREAVAGSLTAESTTEQASAGLTHCTPEEVAHFQSLNKAYKAKHGFPFVMAVRHRNRHQIKQCFEERLINDTTAEFQAALQEINAIAHLRLSAMVAAE